MAMNLLTRDEGLRIAANIAKLTGIVRSRLGYHSSGGNVSTTCLPFRRSLFFTCSEMSRQADDHDCAEGSTYLILCFPG